MDPDVSIIMPLWKSNKDLLNKISKAIDDQDYDGDIEIIKIDNGWGLAKSINYGISISKHSIIVSLHQDAIPTSNTWLSSLIKPFEDPSVVASVSDVIDMETNKVYTPLMDEKGCAYRKDSLNSVGCFDEKIFLNSGEDMDLYIKLKKIGKIVYPHSTVSHDHPGYLSASGYKKRQNANTNGCLLRVHGTSFPGWWKGIILANIFNPSYWYWFWRGFILKKEDFKR
jgi:GT2 family glycosyltransferase